jgi:uncharacterized protein
MSDQIIREIPLIQRYSRHNEAEDMRFRAFLKFRLDLSNAELDAVVRETTDEVWKHIDCRTCANCCRTMQIEVDNKDIKRLAERLNMTVPQFSKRYIAVDEDKTKHFTTVPCPFLGQDNLCTVYEDRPKACRDFPFLHGNNFRSRTLGVMAHATSCPIVFNVWQALKKRFRGNKR